MGSGAKVAIREGVPVFGIGVDALSVTGAVESLGREAQDVSKANAGKINAGK